MKKKATVYFFLFSTLIFGQMLLAASASFDRTLVPIGPIESDNSWTTWTELSHVYFSNNCIGIKSGHKRALAYLFKQARLEFPVPAGGEDIMYVADMNNRVKCQGHPTHTSGEDIDLTYFTNGPTNYTQKIRGVVNIQMVSVVKDLNGKKIVDVKTYDWDRTYKIWKMLSQAFPEVRISANEKLVIYTKEKASARYGKEVVDALFNKFIGGDEVVAYNHHSHFHADLGAIINWAYFDDRLYFPHIAANSGWDSEVVLVNINDMKEVNGWLYAFDEAGNVIEQKNILLAPNRKITVQVEEVFSDPAKIKSMIYVKDRGANVRGHLKFSQKDGDSVVASAITIPSNGTIYMPHIASDKTWWTGLALLNTTSQIKNLKLSFGSEIYKDITLAAGEHRAFTMDTLFQGEVVPALSSAIIRGSEGVVALNLNGTRPESKNRYLSGSQLGDEIARKIYVAETRTDNEIWSGLVLTNFEAVNSKIAIKSVSKAGEIIQQQELTLGERKKFSKAVNGDWQEIISSTPISGIVVYGRTDGRCAAGVEAASEGIYAGVFTNLSREDSVTLALTNIEDTSVEIELNAYDQNGERLIDRFITLAARSKYVELVDKIFPEVAEEISHIKVFASGAIIGTQLNKSFSASSCDALSMIKQ
ncbi:MAG: hypothetical protein A2504_13810 [Bdellovibrionales bacterium RIFOXYD12_FULL_39_22]|nr:MAG: hypothetical protein A2385_00535 [Bdellovibrionales bacterium RIFOXYB1_FULL_39_21]OFZ43836.1 MAG: hypothetical protein A2485_04995 [Bdellovibrionales bacterium RIFOXYC12_FULL_39_17]OFZ48830.1 MAG: hypothetical protein A2404_17850 [Bdellovibrionales bacterium RIFOXYC1_FULL_39_130]OFZ76563.1 MAG: hypothetical protein A2560_06515 [Bdellovibrionales bacterium RIFOXYD1_FULL_39_84]OFZ94797.1 MAG: hypothetical protein A2504_13810 [Bdellovibrionales bacterium RIFOXYD12_FULL_39_22]HLE12221.1 hy